MLRKFLTVIIVGPLLILIVGFAVANRQLVQISFDPFDQSHPAAKVTLPLFLIIFILVILGVILGGVASWLRQRHWRRSARKLDAEVRALHAENDALKRQIVGAAPAQHSAASVPQLALPPTP